MRILADHDVYKITVDNLRKWGYDVAIAKEPNMHRAPDEELLAKANETNRLLITRDKDFGAILFLKKEFDTGVVLLRGNPNQIEKLHNQLSKLLHDHSEEELKASICVVEHDKYRIRRL